MEKRHYINKKKACMLDMYGIIIFFLFFFLLAWTWTFEDLEHGIHSFVYCLMTFFEFKTKQTNKSATLEPSSQESFHLLQTRSACPSSSASHCKCTEGIPCHRPHDGLTMANIKVLLLTLFLIRKMPPIWGLKLCCCWKQSKIYFLKKKKSAPF